MSSFGRVLLQVFNRLVGMVVWVAVWNLLDLAVDGKNITLNVVIGLVSLLLWGLSGEYTVVSQNSLPVVSNNQGAYAKVVEVRQV